MQTTPENPIHAKIERVLLVFLACFMLLCVPDISYNLKAMYGKDAGEERLREAATKVSLDKISFDKPYPRGKVAITQTGNSIILTTRSDRGKPLCIVKDAQGNLFENWHDERHDLCPMVGSLPLPNSSPVADKPDCADTKCLLARVEVAVWQCAENSGTMEGCQTPAKLIEVGELDPVTPLLSGADTVTAGAVKVASALDVDGDVMYTIIATDGKHTFILDYLSSMNKSAQLTVR